MEGVLTVKDSRENLNKMQQWRNEAAKEVSKQNTTNVLNTVIDVLKVVTSVVGTVATVVAGVVATPAASPVVAKTSLAFSGALDGAKMLLNGQPREQGVEKITASLTDLRNGVKDVSIRDKNLAKQTQVSNNNLNTMSNSQNVNMVM